MGISTVTKFSFPNIILFPGSFKTSFTMMDPLASNNLASFIQLQFPSEIMPSILAVLLPFLLLAISSASEPPPHKKCNKDAIFALHDIAFSSLYIYSTPSHLAVAQGTIDFNLTNTAVPYTTRCPATSGQITDFFYGDIVYQCDVPTGQRVGPESSTNFTFSRPDGVFDVNQV